MNFVSVNKIIIGILSGLLLLVVTAPGSLLIDKKLLAHIEKQYGPDARKRLVNWSKLVIRNTKLTDLEKLKLVNNFFNKVQFISDKEHWKKTDYWATPLEFLTTNGGDCEDFSIAKYFTLRELGVPMEKLRLTYVKSLTLNQAHMVLSYFVEPVADPLILDNIIKKIKPASDRRDLIPVYSFNGEGLWIAKERGQGRFVGDSRKISPWNNMMGRMRAIKISS